MIDAAVTWLAALELAGAAVFAGAALLDHLLRRRCAATRRGVWALAVAVALALPLTRLALPTTALVLPIAGPLLAVWAAGAAALLARLLHGWAAARRRCRRSEPLVGGPWAASLTLLRGDDVAVELRVSDEILAPQTIGALRPAILVPRAMVGASADERRAMLAHELAHVARADCLLLLAGAVARAIYWISPLSWRALRQLRAHAEDAADDAALLTGIPCSSYAAQLLAVARAQLDRAGRVASDGLRERIRRVLDGRRIRSGGSTPRWGVPRLAATALLCAGLVTACEARSVDAGRPASALPGR